MPELVVGHSAGAAVLARMTLDGPIDLLQAAMGRGGSDAVRPLESQFLLQQRGRLYADLHFS